VVRRVVLQELQAEVMGVDVDRDFLVRRKFLHEAFHPLGSPGETVEPAVHAIEQNDGGVAFGGRSGDAGVRESVGWEWRLGLRRGGRLV
jgi:hypothetical protein